ncbi:MAG: peptidoglycan-binding domain-containing protein [Ornithinimicrobium sp.]
MFAGGQRFRRSVGVALALSIAYAPSAVAQEGDSGDTGATNATSSTDSGGAPEASDTSGGESSSSPASGSGDEGSGDSGATTSTPESSTESHYGGRATGPSPLPLLPDDPAYPIAEPPESETLPDELDIDVPYQSQVVCDPVDKPGLEAFGNLIGEHYDRPTYSTSRSCIDQKSDHHDGRALDWPLDAGSPTDRRIGDAVVTWLTENDGEMAKRFGIQSIIWNAHSWRPNGGGWQGYVGQSAHTDHIHFSFSRDGAMMRTSWWTGVPLDQIDFGPCAGTSAEELATPQGARTEACETTEDLGPVPLEEFMVTPYTPYLRDELEQGSRGAAVEVLQRGVDTTVDGDFGPLTAQALLDYTTEHPWLVPSEETSALLWYALELQSDPTLPYRRTTVEEGDRGPLVEIVQEMVDAETDGIFGPKTADAVRTAQTEAGVEPTGVVDGPTWDALDVGQELARAIADLRGGNVDPSSVRD